MSSIQHRHHPNTQPPHPDRRPRLRPATEGRVRIRRYLENYKELTDLLREQLDEAEGDAETGGGLTGPVSPPQHTASSRIDNAADRLDRLEWQLTQLLAS